MEKNRAFWDSHKAEYAIHVEVGAPGRDAPPPGVFIGPLLRVPLGDVTMWGFDLRSMADALVAICRDRGLSCQIVQEK